MPTILENLLNEHSVLLQKIIDQAKKDALQSSSAISGSVDLFSHILSNFDNLIKDKKEKNILTPYADPYNWPRNNNCWAKSLDLTGYAAAVVPLGGVGGGTLTVSYTHLTLPTILLV